jgi:predicted RNase H-like HicB family nuclease
VTDTSRYSANIFWSDEDEGFIAICPELPGSSAFGTTKQEALAELQDAIASWIEASINAGLDIPEPAARRVPAE